MTASALLYLLLGVASLSGTAAAAAASIGNLTVEYRPVPVVAVDVSFNARPRFAWQLSGGLLQASYRIVVSLAATAARVETVIWDSGAVASNASAQVSYGGAAALAFEEDFVWRLSVTFADGSAAAAPAAHFGTGPDAAAWAAGAVWLGGCTQAQASPQLRLSFALSSMPVLRARAFATGLGIYTLHLNGARVGGGADVLTPGWSTVPTARVLADAYDVSGALLPGGENVLGMRLGQAKYGYVGEFCAAGDATCYAALLHVAILQSTADGRDNVTIVSTATPGWQCAPSPITFNHLFGGETYNASLHQRGWDSPGFAPAVPWAAATPRSPAPAVAQVTTAGAPIRIMANVTPASVTAHTSSQPVVGNGLFVKSDASPDVWWVPSANTTKNFVTVCTPCEGLDACALLVPVSQQFIDGLAQGANFSCGMLPVVNSSVFIFDLSRNMAGFCSLRTPPAPAGTVLTLAHGEILSTTGDVKNTFGASAPPRSCPVNVINCADQMDEFVYSEDSAAGGEVFTPSFTFHGFRYVGLYGWPAGAPAPGADALTCHQAHSDMALAGSLDFNSTTLNQIQAAIVQTQRSNVFSIPSDCPTREKRGWLGDSQGSSAQALSNLRIGPFYENFCRSFLDSVSMSCAHKTSPPLPTRPDDYKCCDFYDAGASAEAGMFGCQPGLTPVNATGSLPDVVPFDSISGWPGDWVWQAAGEVIPAGVLAAEGNVAWLELLWPYVSAHMAFVAEAAADGDSGGLLMFGPYSDWLAEEPVSLSYAANFYLVYCAQLSAFMAGALGRPQEAAAYVALAEAKSAAMVAELFNASTGTWDRSTNANAQAMALAVGLGGAATSPFASQTAAAMVADVAAHSGHPTGGVTSIRWILQGLTAANRSDLALAMALVPTSPSWAYMATPDMREWFSQQGPPRALAPTNSPCSISLTPRSLLV